MGRQSLIAGRLRNPLGCGAGDLIGLRRTMSLLVDGLITGVNCFPELVGPLDPP